MSKQDQIQDRTESLTDLPLTIKQAAQTIGGAIQRSGFGNDVLLGGSGDDVLLGGAGLDVLIGNTGGDRL